MRFNDFLLEHNVFNLDKLEKWLSGYALELSTADGKNWFTKTLKKQIVNTENPENWLELLQQAPRGAPDWAVGAVQRGELYQFVPRQVPTDVKEELEHIADYIRWLEDNKDTDIEAGRALSKLNKQSFELLSVATEQWVVTLNRKAEKKEKQRLKDTGVSEEPGVDIEMKWKDGWFIARLMTSDACGREGILQHHCIGSYGSRMESGEIQLYSLRDPQNKPYVSMEVSGDGSTLNQVKGPHNRSPDPISTPYLKDFVKARQFNVQSDSMYATLGLLKLGDVIWDPEEKMPDIINGSMHLAEFSGTLNFPKKFRVNGSMFMSKITVIGTWPEDLYVEQELDIEGARITKLPSKLYVGQDCHCTSTLISEIPEGIHVGGELTVAGTKIRKLPIKWYIGKGMDFEDTDLEMLPENFVVTEYLDITNCKKLKKLPKNMSIGGGFYIGKTNFTIAQVKKMPGIKVGGKIENTV